MKINFCWDWKPSFEQAYQWSDGLAAALVELQNRGHEVMAYTDSDIPVPNPMIRFNPVSEMDGKWADVILHWGDFTRPHATEHAKLGKPMAICFAGGEVNNYNTELFDHVFVESQVYKDNIKHNSVSIAFGTNTDLFKPIEQAKYFDALFPSTFAAWKRHELFARATKGLKALAVGYMYDDHETECWQVCIDNGALVLPHVSAQVLHRLYAASQSVVIPSRSDGGSQRTLLEALAMNVPVVVTDSDKFDYGKDLVFKAEPDVESLTKAVNKAIGSIRDTRGYILDSWSHIKYADALEEGLCALL